jgi:hypothetical protein
MVRRARFAGPREVVWRQWNEDHCLWGSDEPELLDLQRVSASPKERALQKKAAAVKRRLNRLPPDRRSDP